MKKGFMKFISLASAAVLLSTSAMYGNIISASAAYSKGDVDGNGTVAVDDAGIALAIYAKTAAGLSVSEYTQDQFTAADINADSSVTISDAAAILTYYAQTSAGMNPSWGDHENTDKNPDSDYDDGIMRASMTAMDYAQEMGVGLNLGNTFDAYWEQLSNTTSGCQTIGQNQPSNYETCWGGIVTTESAIAGMAAEGFNTVRIPVYWGNMMANDGKYTVNEAYIDRVAEVVDWCMKNDLYAVINMHHYDAFLVKNKDKAEALRASEIVWTQVADRFKNYSDYLIFEGYNEALGTGKGDVALSDSEAYPYVNEMNQVFVDAVRATGGNNADRILIASGYWTNIDKTTDSRYIVPTDSAKDRMMVSVHYIDNGYYWTNQIGNNSWLSYSKSQCELLKNAFTSRNIPVFVGECTGSYSSDCFASDANTRDSSECLSTIIGMAADYGFVPVLWDVNDGFYSRTQYKIKNDSDGKVIEEIATKIENR